MKNLLLTFVLILGTGMFANASKPNRLKYDSLSCLRIEGKVLNADEDRSACIVEIIGLNDEVDTISLKDGKTKFKYVLKKDCYYAIRVSKPGYLSKLICVNTEVLTETNGLFVFEFQTTLIKEAAVKTLNADALDFPVAIIHFDYEKESFSYNKEYSAQIKRELHTVKPTRMNEGKKTTLAALPKAVTTSN